MNPMHGLRKIIQNTCLAYFDPDEGFYTWECDPVVKFCVESDVQVEDTQILLLEPDM